jgi:hypothetical protein
MPTFLNTLRIKIVGIAINNPRILLFHDTESNATIAPTKTIIDCNAEHARMKIILIGEPSPFSIGT